MELFSLLATLCLLVLMNDPMRGERSSFYRWRRGVYSLDTLKWKEQTTFLRIDCTANTPSTVIGEAAWDEPLKMGPRHARDGAVAPQTGPKWPHLWWVAFIWASRWVLQSLAPFGVDLIWVLAFSPPNWALVTRPSPLGLVMDDVTPCLIAHFERVILVFQACALQNM
jgi:hypothetical protein